MGDAFNPYSHWLKLPPQRWKPTYYEILGIERSAKDKDEIIARGKKLYSEVKAAPLVGREKEHKALLAEIEEAVRTFASNTKRTEYDSQLEPPIGDSFADTKPIATKLQAVVPTALSVAKVPTPDELAFSLSSGPGSNAASTGPAFSMPPMAVPASAISSPAPVQPTPRPVARPIAKPIGEAPATNLSVNPIFQKPPGTQASTAAASLQRHRKTQARNNSILIALSGGGVLLVVILAVLFRGQIATALASNGSKPPVEENQTGVEKAVTVVKPIEDRPEEADPDKSSTAAPNSDGMPPTTVSQGNPETAPMPPADTKPEMKPEVKPETEPTPPPMPITFTAEEATKLKAHCESIVAAMKVRDVAKAGAELDQAQTLAKPQGAKATVEGLATVLGPLRAFWSAFDEAWKSLKPGDEITVGASTKVKVASITETELEIETASGKRKQTRESISAGLLVALVRTKLDPVTPDAKLALGVFHLTDKSGNIQEGSKLLGEVTTTSLTPDLIKTILAEKFDFAAQVTSAVAPEAITPPATPPSGDATQMLVSQLRTALRDRKLAEAEKLEAQVNQIAAVSDAKPSLAAEVQLSKYATQFWNIVAKGIESFEGTEELQIGDEVIVVIEKGKEKLICRVRGKRTEYAVKDMPVAVAIAVAEKTSDRTSAAFDLAQGAAYFTQKIPDAARAKVSWEAAKSKGAEAADLLMTLTP